MLARLIYACSQPSARPLRRVTLYYVGLFALCAVLVRWVPGVTELVIQEPIGVDGFTGLSDSFEPIGASDLVRSQLEVAPRLLVNLMAALLLMLPVSWVYMGTRTRTGFDQAVVQTMIILPIAVAGVVTIVQNSIALAFSLAGIVAGVRFRNALKDTADALYIFAAIAVGLASGIGALLVAAIISLFFNFVILLLWRCDYGVCPKSGPMLEYTSGQTFAKLGIDLPPPTTEADVSIEKGKAKKKHPKKKGHKKKGHKKKSGGAPAIVETSDPAAAAVTDAGTVVATPGEDVPETPDPEDR